MKTWNWKRGALVGGGFLLGSVVVLVAWQGVRAYSAWNSIDRVEFDTSEARERLPEGVTPGSDAINPTPTFVDVEYQTVLAIGSDAASGDERNRQEGVYADAVLFYLAPDNGDNPILVSLPRNLLVINPCIGEETKLDRTLEGCGQDISGPELVALAVEDFTGIAVDHFALFDFDGFMKAIDAVGGVELCVPNSLRQGNTDLLPAGCSVVYGATALNYVRSRTTQELVDGEWRFVEDESDLNRATRQQQVMFAMLARLKTIGSPATLAAIAENLGPAITLSDTLSLSGAVGLAWNLRSVPSSQIKRLIVPTEPVMTADGTFALRATVAFQELLEG